MVNLLEETLKVISQCGVLENEIQFVSNDKYYMTWDEFVSLAKDLNYDNGYGGQEIDDNLKIVAKDWWLERHEYDGSEWWEYKSLPTKPRKHALFELRDKSYC